MASRNIVHLQKRSFYVVSTSAFIFFIILTSALKLSTGFSFIECINQHAMFENRVFVVAVDGGWSDSSQWSHCTKNVNGIQMRTRQCVNPKPQFLSLIHISEPTRPERISYAVFCLKKKIIVLSCYSNVNASGVLCLPFSKQEKKFLLLGE